LSGICIRRSLGSFVAQREQVANRQHVPRYVLDVPRVAVGPKSWSVPTCSLFEKLPPALGDDRPDFGNRKLVQTAADDFLPRRAQQFARADTGFW
jgi:hypothetical protein